MLPFLDTKLTQREGGVLDTAIYRKQMHTDRYLHFNSHHPVSAKRAAVKSLFHIENIYNTRGGARRARTPGGREASTGSHPIRKWCESMDQEGLREVQLEGCLQMRTNPPFTTHQGEGSPPKGEAGRCGLPDPLPVWKGVCWGDAETPRDENQRAQGCMHEGGYLEVCHCKASMGSATPSRLEWDEDAGQGH